MESENLKKLEELIPRLDEMILAGGNPKGFVEYETDIGTCLGFTLYKNKQIAVQRTFLTKGTEFPKHVHDKETEIIIIFQGKGKRIIYNDDGSIKDEKIIDEGDCDRIEKGTLHSWYMLEDTWMIGITIPASEAYPGV